MRFTRIDLILFIRLALKRLLGLGKSVARRVLRPLRNRRTLRDLRKFEMLGKNHKVRFIEDAAEQKSLMSAGGVDHPVHAFEFTLARIKFKSAKKIVGVLRDDDVAPRTVGLESSYLRDSCV